jgi:hypothetical protein
MLEADMIRVRAICTVKYGQFREFMRANEELNAVCEARGWARATFLVPVVGAANEFVAEFDYADLASFNDENQAAMADAEYMKIFRSAADLIYPQSARTELYETAGHIA